MSSTHAPSSPLHALSQTCTSQTEDNSMDTSASMPSKIPLCSWVIGVPMATVVGISLLFQIAAFSLVSPETDNPKNPQNNVKDFFRENAVHIAVAHMIVTAVAGLYCILLTCSPTCLPKRRSCLSSRAGARSRVRLSHAQVALGLVLVLCFVLFAIENSFILTRKSRDVKGGQGGFMAGILLALDVVLAVLIALDIGLGRLHRRMLRDLAHPLQEDGVGDQESTAELTLWTVQRPSQDLPKYERYAAQEPRDGDAPLYSA